VAELSMIEKRQLEQLFEMRGGYVLDFSNRTLQEFVATSVGTDIYDERYHFGSGSKANRLREFWKVEQDEIAGKLIADLIEYAGAIKADIDQELVAKCQAVARRLLTKHGSAVASPAIAEPAETTSDTEQHKDWVREFADELAANGIHVRLDQYDLSLGDDRFHFMESSVRDADAVLCICTPQYVAKANSRSSGVGVETSLITPQFYERMKMAKQFIPIIRATDPALPQMPDYLAALICVDFRNDEGFQMQMEQLIRHLYRQPKHPKPQPGPRPSFS
jgi:hypothetical protein